MDAKQYFLFFLLTTILFAQVTFSFLEPAVADDSAHKAPHQNSLFEKLKTDWSNVSLEGFWASFSMIIVSEIGDKTFFIAAVLAMKHSRFIVWLGAAGALLFMTILAVVFGSIFQYLSPFVTQYLAGVIFFVFAFKLLRDAKNMKGGEAKDELREVEQQLLEQENNNHDPSNQNGNHDIELGDTQIVNRKIDNNNETNNVNDILDDDPKGKKRHLRTKFWDFSILIRSFGMTFISEIGDRSQITTVVLAAHKNPYGVTLGASSGHAICTGIAVIGGKLLASRISERNVTLIGGILFLLFGLEC